MPQPIDAIMPLGDVGSMGTPGNLQVFSYKILQADVVNDNAVANTLQDVTGMSLAVVAGATYWFRFVIDYTSAALTTGSRWTLDGPAFTRLTINEAIPLVSTANTVAHATDYADVALANAGANSPRTAGAAAKIEGFITPSASGTLQLRFASEVAGSAITAKAGSILKYMRVL